MRLAAALAATSAITKRFPDAMIARTFDGPRGYTLVVRVPGGGDPRIVRTKADVRKVRI